MRVIILTQYFPPETGAPQNRLWALARGFAKRGARVTVLTAMPNYPAMKVMEGYRGKWFMKESMDGITVHRAWIHTSARGGMLRRLASYFSFVLTSLLAGLKLPRADYLLCESPPLFLGWSAWILSRLKGAKMIFNISDLWPESAEKLGLVKNRTALGLARWLEMFLYRKSFMVTGQTQGIVDNIAGRVSGPQVYWLPNGADFPDHGKAHDGASWRREAGYGVEDFLFLYAGIIGHAQGLEVVLHAAKKVPDGVKFILLGDGPEKERLVNLKSEIRADNVAFMDPVPKTEMPRILAGADAGIVPLRNLPLFRGAIPSKIFELMVMKKPILLGVDGEARRHFIDRAGAGLFFTPGDTEDLSARVRDMIADRAHMREMGLNGHAYAREHFDRQKITGAFYSQLEGALHG